MTGQEHSTPMVTVLMTLYNKGPFVEEAMRSVLDGTFQDLELLVIDDASTDDGPATVERMTDPRIRLLRAERNGGRAAAANRGYGAARGRYIAVLDADDTAHPERLEKQVAFMEAHPEVGACGTAAQYFGGRSDVASWPLTDRECRGKLLFTDPVLYGSAIFRAAVIQENGLRSNEQWTLPAEDYLFTVSMSPHTRFANLPDVLLNYRIGDQNQRHGRDPVADREQVCRAIFDFFSIEATDAEFGLQLLFHKLVRDPITVRTVHALWAWRAKLVALNRSRRIFPEDVFEAHLEQCWDTAYHVIADHGLGPALAHMRRSGRWSLSRLVYAVKVKVARRGR